MIKEEYIKEIQKYITIAAKNIGWDEESQMELVNEVENLIRLQLPYNEKKMRKYVEAAYRDAAFVYSTGHSFLFYKRHDRQPIELRFAFNKEDLYCVREGKMKYVTEEEFDIIRDRLKSDSSKKYCKTLCDRFWKSEKNSYRFCVPVRFYGENFDYCDKSRCEYHDDK